MRRETNIKNNILYGKWITAESSISINMYNILDN